jgi:hypothetical protein
MAFLQTRGLIRGCQGQFPCHALGPRGVCQGWKAGDSGTVAIKEELGKGEQQEEYTKLDTDAGFSHQQIEEKSKKPWRSSLDVTKMVYVTN